MPVALAPLLPLANSTVIFRPGEGGYPYYRIPALLLAGRVLLAFAEGRKQRTDHGWVDIVLKRSLDGGDTWSALSVVHTESIAGRRQATVGNPTPLYDAPEAVLFLCRENAEVLMTKSLDGGLSWSVVEPLPWSRPPEWRWVATGPPAGLVTRTGRWLIPCDGYVGHERFYSATEVFSFVLYSDDRGATWQQGPLLTGGNECQAAQLDDGSLLLNMRSRDVRRLFSRSHDDGATWSDPSPAKPSITDGNAQGSMVALHSGATLLHTNAGVGRSTMYTHISYNRGATWRTARLRDGPVGYSALLSLAPLASCDEQAERSSGSAAAAQERELGTSEPSPEDLALAADWPNLVGILFEDRLPETRGQNAEALVFGRLEVEQDTHTREE